MSEQSLRQREDHLERLLIRRRHPTPYWSDPLRSMEDAELPSEAEIRAELKEIRGQY